MVAADRGLVVSCLRLVIPARLQALNPLALQRRFRSREKAPFGDKLLAAMREQFGGHAVKRET